MKILNVNCKSNTAAISRFKKHRLLFNLLRSPKIHQANVASDSNIGKRIINPLPPITILNPAPTPKTGFSRNNFISASITSSLPPRRSFFSLPKFKGFEKALLLLIILKIKEK